MKKLLALLALLAAVTTAFAAETTPPADKCTEEITLSYITAGMAFQIMDLNPEGKPIARTTEPQYAGPAYASPIPKGVETIAIGKDECEMLITGSRSAIHELKAYIAIIDVEPKNVQVKFDYYEVDAESIHEVDRINEAYSTAFGSGKDKAVADSVRAFESHLKASGLKPLNSPVLTALNHTSVTEHSRLAIQGKARPVLVDFNSSITTSINGDGTITLGLGLSVSNLCWDSKNKLYETRSQSIQTARRLAPGEPSVIGGFVAESGKSIVAVFTATILE